MSEKIAKALGEKYSFQIANTSGSDKIIAVLPAFYETIKAVANTTTGAVAITHTDAASIRSAGFSCDLALDNGTIDTNIVVTTANPKMSVRQFQRFIQAMGRVCREIAVQANNSDYFNNTIEVVKCTPFTGSKSEFLTLSDFRSVDQQATDKVVIPNADLLLDFDTLMLVPVPAGRTITLTFKF